MLRLFGEPEANERAFGALARFLDLLDETPPAESRPALDPLGALVPAEAALARRVPAAPDELRRVRLGRPAGRRSRRAPAAACAPTHAANALRLSPEGIAGIERLLSTPLADAPAAELSERARRDALAVITSSYEEHGGFRLRTLSA